VTVDQRSNQSAIDISGKGQVEFFWLKGGNRFITIPKAADMQAVWIPGSATVTMAE
jgi:hypothetical protein